MDSNNVNQNAEMILEEAKKEGSIKFIGNYAGSKVPFYFNLENKMFAADGEYMFTTFKLVGRLEFNEENTVKCLTRYSYNINSKCWEEKEFKEQTINLTQKEFKFNLFNCVKQE